MLRALLPTGAAIFQLQDRGSEVGQGRKGLAPSIRHRSITYAKFESGTSPPAQSGPLPVENPMPDGTFGFLCCRSRMLKSGKSPEKLGENPSCPCWDGTPCVCERLLSMP